LTFYPRRAASSASKLWSYWRAYRKVRSILNEVLSAPDRWAYTDGAIARAENELETLDLYHATTGGEAALARKRRDDAIRGSVQHAPVPIAAQA
jgi:hypothetical protein